MAGANIDIGWVRRECRVIGHKNMYGYFHGWTFTDDGTMAIVEWWNGAISLIDPEKISFMDVFDKDLKIFRAKTLEFILYRAEMLGEKTFICGVTNRPCIACKPGACESRKEKKDE